MNWTIAIVAMYAGAFAITFLLVRLVSWLLRKARMPSLGIAHAIVAAMTIIAFAYGYADGGPPCFGQAAALYIPPVVVWLIVDWWLARRRRTQ